MVFTSIVVHNIANKGIQSESDNSLLSESSENIDTWTAISSPSSFVSPLSSLSSEGPGKGNCVGRADCVCVEQGDTNHQPAAIYVQLVRCGASGRDGVEHIISSWHNNSADEGFLHLEEGVNLLFIFFHLDARVAGHFVVVDDVLCVCTKINGQL